MGNLPIGFRRDEEPAQGVYQPSGTTMSDTGHRSQLEASFEEAGKEFLSTAHQACADFLERLKGMENHLEKQREKVERARRDLENEKGKVERERQDVARQKADMEKIMRKNKWAFSPSYQSRIENNDATPGQGSKTHQDLRKSYDKFIRNSPREFRRKLAETCEDFSKDDPKKLMCTLFQEVYNQSKTLVLETLFEELQMVLKFAESEDQQLSGGCEPEILWQRRRAYAILLHTASDRLCTSKQQAGMKAIEVLQTKSESFKELHSTAPGLIGTYVKRAAEISWNMVTTSPPCIVWQPPTYNENWHEKLSSKWEVKKGQTGTLVYFESVLFYDASGMDVRKGLVGSVHTAPATGHVIEDDIDEGSDSENDGEYESPLGSRRPLTFGTPPVQDKSSESTEMKWHSFKQPLAPSMSSDTQGMNAGATPPTCLPNNAQERDIDARPVALPPPNDTQGTIVGCRLLTSNDTLGTDVDSKLSRSSPDDSQGTGTKPPSSPLVNDNQGANESQETPPPPNDTQGKNAGARSATSPPSNDTQGTNVVARPVTSPPPNDTQGTHAGARPVTSPMSNDTQGTNAGARSATSQPSNDAQRTNAGARPVTSPPPNDTQGMNADSMPSTSLSDDTEGTNVDSKPSTSLPDDTQGTNVDSKLSTSLPDDSQGTGTKPPSSPLSNDTRGTNVGAISTDDSPKMNAGSLP